MPLLAMCGLALVLALFVVPPRVLPRLRDRARSASGGYDIIAAWSVASLYGDDHNGLFPPLDPAPGRMMFDREVMHPDYCPNPALVTAEYDSEAPTEARNASQYSLEVWGKELIDDHSFIYVGYALTSNSDVIDFFRAYVEQVENRTGFDDNLRVSAGRGTAGSGRFYRLRSDIGSVLSERGLIDEAGAAELAGQIPVLVERPGHYQWEPGGWVAYLDGHREFLTYPGRFPMSEQFFASVALLDMLEEGPSPAPAD